ncbi:hypothetical protein [Neorhizobium galegae]|uniref:hypothetical protein n=1 Tax=Neorhizobium galegae TaxID=399 RepID=UPI001F36793B|nr:hypothetical protein [Neorhizobium galegae]UIK08976.1 hypothetical protein LZK81_29220 [Neorhizobium galegae]
MASHVLDYPRVYALDIVVPAAETEWSEPLVVDVNGSRSGLNACLLKTGDRRLERTVLSRLAEAGAGKIYSPILRGIPKLRSELSLAEMLGTITQPIGINRVNEAYMPIGDSLDYGNDQRTREFARDLGIEFETVIFDWSPTQRTFVSDPGSIPLSNCFQDVAVVWPYSWDWRAVPFPTHARLVNPTCLQLLASNKLYAAAAAGGGPPLDSPIMPPTSAFGFIGRKGKFRDWIASLDRGPIDQWIVKPAQGRRGYGVVVLKDENLLDYAQLAGLAADDLHLRQGGKILAAASLLGDLPEALTILQPFIDPSVRRNPYSGELHSSVQRVTVISDANGVEILDVTTILMRQARGNRAADDPRASHILTPDTSAVCIEPRPKEYQSVVNAVRSCIQCLESYARKTPLDHRQAVMWEALECARFAEQTFDYSCLNEISTAWRDGVPFLDLTKQA